MTLGSAKANRNPAARPSAELKARARVWAETIGVNPRRIQIQAMRTKWASCSSLGTITLSSDLLEQEFAFQEFVLVHELVHLLVPNHGRVFKALMRSYLPDWERTVAGKARKCGFQQMPSA